LSGVPSQSLSADDVQSRALTVQSTQAPVAVLHRLVPVQSAFAVQAVLHAVAEAHVNNPAQSAGAPAVQTWPLLQVLLVSLELVALQEGVPQSDPAAG
jgi:hypothetical protein